MTEAPVSPHLRTTPEAFPAGETADNYAEGVRGGEKKDERGRQNARERGTCVSDFNPLAEVQAAGTKIILPGGKFYSPIPAVQRLNPE
jgi:hypothetical protein